MSQIYHVFIFVKIFDVYATAFLRTGCYAPDDHSRRKRPNWFVIVVMELTIQQINADLRRVHVISATVTDIIRVACRSGGQKKKSQHRNQRVHALNHEENDDLGIYSVYSHGNDSIWIKPCVNGNDILMELDTGSSLVVFP